ncbi:AraC family transcriptional regulator [Gluconacetobacter aggeris]|uniref:AraC family transcriptional regulator n=1 Tax=Gluconacetobacter aggeris TaxID=1286186 RepID=A0A7W4NXA3_9PROT|nr:helix-turn-helix domain-containing protein [Gluconacetobacter aggeris]MBB2167278.1 AraC family transcriptional regulator [Gluconacetobacter aggeris]
MFDNALEDKESLYRVEETREWEVARSFCGLTYAPLEAIPLIKGSKPNAVLKRLQCNDITFSRFCFGTPTRVEDFDPKAGNIIVVNTLRGNVRHPLTGQTHADTKAGESYVVDSSRTDYWNIASGDDLQLNLTIPHSLMEAISERWYGFIPGDDFWKRRIVFGGKSSAWLSLLNYTIQSVSTLSEPDELIARKANELLCIDLLHNWAKGAGLCLESGARSAAPHYVRDAEKLMTLQAKQNPTILDIAAQLSISARSLSAGFREFRGITPHSYMQAKRLEALHEALVEAAPGETVSSIARSFGYVNMSAMAVAYRKRFGRNPLHTLRRR